MVCYFNHEKYDIPKEIVDLKDLEDFNMSPDRLQLQKDGLYHIVKYNNYLPVILVDNYYSDVWHIYHIYI